jgi:prepilin-type N-terminal cleavage/methylation domain-containing protein
MLLRQYARGCNRGFSLIEVLLALGILSAGILAILAVFPGAFSLNKSAWGTTTAVFLAQSKMDQILADGLVIDTSFQSDNPPEIPGGYRRWWGSQNPDGISGLQQINVQVAWFEKTLTRSRLKTITISSLLAP